MHVHTQAQVEEYWQCTYLTRLEVATDDHESQQHDQRPCGPSADVRQSENDGSQQNCTMTSLQANSFPTCLLPQAKQFRLGLPNILPGICAGSPIVPIKLKGDSAAFSKAIPNTMFWIQHKIATNYEETILCIICEVSALAIILFNLL